jgi:transcriptional regulator with XRE-family HTH domain
MNKKLGSYLRRVRKERSLTLRIVEERTGISNAYLSQLENQKIGDPSPRILHKLAECYGISYERLMGLAEYPTLIPEEKKLQPSFRSGASLDGLTAEEKERVEEFVQFLRSRRNKR